MKRSYREGWEDIFGGAMTPAKRQAAKTDTCPVISANDVDWANTRALSIWQPWAEQILRGEKVGEFRRRPTRVRGTIAIYASLGRYAKDKEQEVEDEVEFSVADLPRGVLVGLVELYDCVHHEVHNVYE